MDQRERLNDLLEAARALVEDYLANAWTALPVIIQSFDPIKCTCTAASALSFRIRQKDGTVQWVQPKKILDMPVVFPSGGNFLVTFPITAGDEALAIFADRCIDQWWQNGGSGNLLAELRMHDLSDGFIIVGPRSVPNVPTGISTTTLQVRTKDGTAYIELTADGKVNIVAPGGVHVTGTVTSDSEITAKTTHTVSAHTHPDPQGGNTGAPTG
jgi:hypothetical protein